MMESLFRMSVSSLDAPLPFIFYRESCWLDMFSNILKLTSGRFFIDPTANINHPAVGEWKRSAQIPAFMGVMIIISLIDVVLCFASKLLMWLLSSQRPQSATKTTSWFCLYCPVNSMPRSLSCLSPLEVGFEPCGYKTMAMIPFGEKWNEKKKETHTKLKYLLCGLLWTNCMEKIHKHVPVGDFSLLTSSLNML